jgi:type VI protein secretion system component VasK
MRFPLLDLFLLMFWLFLWILWLFLVVRTVTDIFASRDLDGWSKAWWLVFVIFLPLLGVLAYLVVRGRSMGERRGRNRQAADDGASDLAKLTDLREKGIISKAEFEQGKAKIFA